MIEPFEKVLLDDLEKRHLQLYDMALLSLRIGLRPTEIFKLRGQDVVYPSERRQAGFRPSAGGHGQDAPDVQTQTCGTHLPATPQENSIHQDARLLPDCRQKKLNLAPKDGDGLYAVTLHTMRHTFTSWLAQPGKVMLMGLQKLMRHKNITMTMRYAYLFLGCVVILHMTI